MSHLHISVLNISDIITNYTRLSSFKNLQFIYSVNRTREGSNERAPLLSRDVRVHKGRRAELTSIHTRRFFHSQTIFVSLNYFLFPEIKEVKRISIEN